jgi:hypothetical protein
VSDPIRRGFMCLIDFDLEIEAECDPPSFTAIYATEDQCRELRGCTDGCGMVEVEISLVRVVKHARGIVSS